ncbi:MAG: acetoin utilization protein [Nitrospirales bacterium]|nr:MAG: acetoin utilization protein [Nitrospirales bacterium]
MGKVGFVSETAYLEHEMGHGHPESPDRLRAIEARLSSTGTIDQLIPIEAKPAKKEWIEQVHESSYVRKLESKSPSSGYASLDADTTLCPASLSAAYLAAGGALAAADAVMSQQVDHVFCAVRPPGHHAEADRAMGFCLLNNVAIVAKYLQEHHGLERVLIVDWDVHHGNGTQHTFYDDPSVLFFSTHQFPHYPGTGRSTETGRGDGNGLTVNVPMSGGQGDEEYREVFQQVLIPAAEQFKPDFILISAGFDAHRDDPLASMNLTEDGYATLTRIVLDIAAQHASGRVISCLEGGYHLQALAQSVDQHLLTMVEA